MRFLSLPQLARAWWSDTPGGQETARRSLSRVLQSDYLQRLTVLAHPELALAAPVHCWQPGEVTPSFDALSYRLQSRWTAPVQRLRVYAAQPRAVRRMGGAVANLSRRFQATHDLHMARIYLHYRRTQPEKAAAWVFEELLDPPGYREKLPDAVLQNPQGEITQIIEFGGAYDAARVKKLHDHCVKQGLPYELW